MTFLNLATTCFPYCFWFLSGSVMHHIHHSQKYNMQSYWPSLRLIKYLTTTELSLKDELEINFFQISSVITYFTFKTTPSFIVGVKKNWPFFSFWKAEKSTASYNVSCQPNILWCDVSDERNCKGQGLLAFCNLVPKYFFYNSFQIPDNFNLYWQ